MRKYQVCIFLKKVNSKTITSSNPYFFLFGYLVYMLISLTYFIVISQLKQHCIFNLGKKF